MTKSFLANFVIAAACGLVWTNFAAPAILRTVGIPLAFGMWRIERRNQTLNKAQYIWALGVFTWGLGMFLFFVILRYLAWRVLGANIPVRIFGTLLTWSAAGWLIGVLSVRNRQGADSTRG